MAAVSAPRPAHWRCTTAQGTRYACFAHETDIRAFAEDRAQVYPVPADERDRAGVWCSFCNPQGDITHTKESKETP